MTSLRYCTWSSKDKEWRWRKLRGPGALDDKGRKVFLHVGRIPYFSIHGENKELFFLRSILINRPCRSFADARTVEGITYQTYKEACVALNLFVDDNEQERVMEEVVGLKSAPLVRQCFVSLLVFCEPANCLQLFERFVRWMGDDFALRTNERHLPLLSDVNRARVLGALQDLLMEHGRSLEHFNLPMPEVHLLPGGERRESSVIRQETEFDLDLLTRQAEEMEESLSPEQATIFHAVVDTVLDDTNKIFAINAAGGTGEYYYCTQYLLHVLYY